MNMLKNLWYDEYLIYVYHQNMYRQILVLAFADFVVVVAGFVVGSDAVGFVVVGLAVFVVGSVAAVGSVAVVLVVSVVGSVVAVAGSVAAAVETVEIAVELKYVCNL